MKRELKVLLGLLTIIMTAFIIMPSCSEDDDMIVGQPSPRGFLHHGPTMVTHIQSLRDWIRTPFLMIFMTIVKLH